MTAADFNFFTDAVQERKTSLCKKSEALSTVVMERMEKRSKLLAEAKNLDRSFKEEFRQSQTSLYGELQKCYRHRDGDTCF